MHPEQIKAELRMRGITASGLADSMDLTRMAVSNVIHGRSKSRNIATRIASILGLTLDDIWPGRYTESRSRPRGRRRP